MFQEMSDNEEKENDSRAEPPHSHLEQCDRRTSKVMRNSHDNCGEKAGYKTVLTVWSQFGLKIYKNIKRIYSISK